MNKSKKDLATDLLKEQLAQATAEQDSKKKKRNRERAARKRAERK